MLTIQRAGGLQLWRRSLLPPCVLIAAGWSALLAALLLTVGRLEPAYRDLNLELPACTLCLIQLERLVLAWWWLLPMAGTLLLLAILSCRMLDHRFERLDQLVLRLPWLGRVVRLRLHCAFLRAIAWRLQAGGDAASAVAASTAGFRNRAARSAFSLAAARVAAGTDPVLVLAEAIGLQGAAASMAPLRSERQDQLERWCRCVADGLEAAADDAVAGCNRFALRLDAVLFGLAAAIVLAGLAMPTLFPGQDHRQYG